jgi:putative transposase
MARRRRLVAAGVPVHVLWRGTAGSAIAHDDEDRTRLIRELRDAAAAWGLRTHAYALMRDHLHVVLSADDAMVVPAALQAVGRSYVRHFNRRHSRSGTLWEGRYRSTLIEPGAWLLSTLRYVERNPVRAGIVDRPEDYPWSSHGVWAGLTSTAWLSPTPEYWALGNTPYERQERWRALCADEATQDELAQLRRHVHSGWPLGSEAFLRDLEERFGLPQAPRRPGRPRRAE